MKNKAFALMMATALAACGGRPTIDGEAALAAAQAAYGPEWDVAEFWPGEYPAGLAITGPDVVLRGRVAADPKAARNIACRLPQNAVLHPWNQARAGELFFIGAQKKVTATVTQDAVLDALQVGADFDPPGEPLNLKAGARITFVRYHAEGYGVIEVDGVEYETQIDAAAAATDLPLDTEFEEALWVRTPCTGGDAAWLLFHEVVNAPGVGAPEITSFGEAKDIGAP